VVRKIRRTPKKSPPVKLLHTETVDIDTLVQYPKNPRRSELEDLAESLEDNGQFSPVVVRLSNRHILIGNHRIKAAKRILGWSTIYVQYVECDDKRAAKVVLADNNLGEKGAYDELERAELLASLDNPTVGTGYSEEDVENFTAILDQTTEELKRTTYDSEALIEPDKSKLRIDGEEEEEQPKEDSSFDKVSDKLSGTLQLSDDMDLPASDRWGEWDIPRLRTDRLMLPSEWPDDISVWAGGATRDLPENDDRDHWWLYIFGISSVAGIKHLDRAIMCYYTFDFYFERWFWEPAKYTTRMLNSGIKYAISPNFSTWATDPMHDSLHALYRSRWMARYFQEAGLKVIPDVEWPSSDDPRHQKFLEDYVLPSLPKKLPMIAMQANVVTGNVTKETMARDKKRLAAQYRLIVDTLQPEAIVYYGRSNWIEFIDSLGLKTKIIGISNHREEMGKKYRDRNKDTL